MLFVCCERTQRADIRRQLLAPEIRLYLFRADISGNDTDEKYPSKYAAGHRGFLARGCRRTVRPSFCPRSQRSTMPASTSAGPRRSLVRGLQLQQHARRNWPPVGTLRIPLLVHSEHGAVDRGSSCRRPSRIQRGSMKPSPPIRRCSRSPDFRVDDIEDIGSSELEFYVKTLTTSPTRQPARIAGTEGNVQADGRTGARRSSARSIC